MTVLNTYQMKGWSETNSEGIASVYLSVTDEGMTTSPSDTPANTVFRPRITNAEQFSIKRAPVMWVHGSQASQAAAFGQLQIDNYDGAFDFLLSADLRDSTVIIQLPVASALLTGTTMSTALVVATGIIDAVTSDNEDVITVSIKDTIARLDRQLPAKVNPPYAAQGAANVMVPISLGACRNVQPLLVDTANRLFQLHDGNIPNVAGVFDKGAPLDPHASPPQYVPALNGSGLQLQTMPVGLLTADVSSFGSQAVIPGINDVLAGAGGFTGTWTGSPAVPPGWTWSNNAGSSITELFNPPYLALGSVNGAQLISATVWQPGVTYGDQLKYAGVLAGGSSYRVTFSLYNVQAEQPSLLGGMVGGIMVASALSANSHDYISGYGQPLNTGAFAQQQTFAFEFTVPAGAARDLIFIAVPSAGPAANVANGTVSAILFDVKLELLGQFQSLPLSGIPFDNYCTEILVNRAGESASIFNAGEAAAIYLRADGSLVPFGMHYDAPPNVLEALRTPLSSRGAVMFTDATGTLRFRKLIDPSNPANTIKCDFDQTNVMRPIKVQEDRASNLTTLFGARPNQKVATNADFVTDTTIVPVDQRTRYTRKSQFWINSSNVPAGQYSFAISAPIFDTCMDLPTDVQVEADRVVAIWSPNIYSNGTSVTGKRRLVTFTAFYDDPTAVGRTITAAVTDIQYGDIVRLTYPTHGFNNTPCEVKAWTLFPFANKIEIEALV